MISIVILSKDEASLDDTLTAVTSQVKALGESAEIIVVDASDHRLDYIRLRHEVQVRWVQFDQPSGVTVTIPHQRNAGVHEARGEVIVFINTACQPEPDWLTRLVAPLPALLLIPARRNRSDGALSVLSQLAFKVTFGAGVLAELFIP